MTFPFSATIQQDCVTFTGLTGKNYVIPKNHAHNTQIRAGIKELLAARKALDVDEVNRLWQQIEDLTDVPRSLGHTTGGRVQIKDNRVYYDGEVIHSALADRILWGLSEGFDMSSYVAFMENLMQNPSKRAVDELFLFLEKCAMGITEDGHIIAYKKVRDNYRDIYTGKVDHSIGQKPSMPRNKVDEDKNRTCSYGFHFCSMSYLPHFGAGSGNRIVIVKVNPRDVVAIPADYNHAKARCCTYEVIGEYTGDDTKDILSGRAVWRTTDVERVFNSDVSVDDTRWDSEDDLDDYVGWDSVVSAPSKIAPQPAPAPSAPKKSRSSAIKAIGYDQGTLTITFISGSVYDYQGVPRRLYEAFTGAESLGEFFNQHILKYYIGNPK